MQNKPNRLWIIALLLGWLFDFLFWKNAPGLSFAIYVTATLAAGTILLWTAGVRPARWTLVLALPILFFAAMTFIRLEPLSIILAYLSTFVLMTLLAFTFQGGRWVSYGVADYVAKSFDLLASIIARPLTFVVEIQRMKSEQAAGTEGQDKRPKVAWAVVRGLLLAVPVVAFFMALLSSADPIFAERVGDLVELFRLENLPEYIFRVVYICILAYMLAGIFLHAAVRSQDEKLLGQDKPLLAPFFGFTEATIVLGSVILLFGAFVIIQFQYFFGGQVNIRIEGYTYAEYVHKGFGELVTVAFFTLLLFLGLSAVVKREAALRQKVFSALGVLLFALVAMILVSAYQRLILYEDAYGFTRLRTYIHVFMVWVAVLLAVVVVLDLLRRQRAFALAAVLAMLGFAATLLLMNVDGFIVRQNVGRVAAGKDLDVGYLALFSADAVPELVDLYQSPALARSTHDKLGAILACYQAAHPYAPDQKPAWQSFHLSTYWAENKLVALKTDLEGYTFDESGWPRTVKTPLRQSYPCASYVED